MIQVKNVIKSFKNGNEPLYAVGNVSFDIADGDFVVILGESGSGKSTLLNCLSGLDKPDSGSITYDGIDICALSDGEITKFRRDFVAFVFQQYYLLPSMTVKQNIAMGAHLANNKDTDSILSALGLQGKEKFYPSQLSGGQQQRVAIARAIAKLPKVLFCDEPTGALDAATGEEVINYLQQIRKTYGLTLIMVTHNTEIAKLATKVIRMSSGKLRENV